MAENRFNVTLGALEASVRVDPADVIEEQETQPPVPDLVPSDERHRLDVLRAGGMA